MKRTSLIAVIVGLAAVAVVCQDAFGRNRMYNPAVGRFMQRDPAGLIMVAPPRILRSSSGSQYTRRDPSRQFLDGMNLYQYVRSSPQVFLDASGWQSENATTGSRPAEVFDVDINLSTVNFFVFFRPPDAVKTDFKMPCSKNGFIVNDFTNCRETLSFQELTAGGCDTVMDLLKKKIEAGKKAGWKPEQADANNSLIRVDGSTVASDISVCELASMWFKVLKQEGDPNATKSECPSGYDCCDMPLPENRNLKARLQMDLRYFDFFGTPKCLINAVVQAEVSISGKVGFCMRK